MGDRRGHVSSSGYASHWSERDTCGRRLGERFGCSWWTVGLYLSNIQQAASDGDGVSVEVLSTNGHDGEVETQQSLFFWAEFLAETPAKPKGNGKSQLGTLSMFEWALSLEQNRE